MAAVVVNLHHNVSTDVVVLLWVVSYVGIRRVEPSAREPILQIGCYADLSG